MQKISHRFLLGIKQMSKTSKPKSILKKLNTIYFVAGQIKITCTFSEQILSPQQRAAQPCYNDNGVHRKVKS